MGSETFVAQSAESLIWVTHDSLTSSVGVGAVVFDPLAYPGHALSQSGRSASGCGVTGETSGMAEPYAEYAR